MTDQDKKEFATILAEALNKNDNGIPSSKAVTEWLFRALLAILTFYGVGVYQKVNTVYDYMSAQQIESEYEKQERLELKALLKEPRYTKNQHDSETAPLVNQVNRNSAQINTINPLIEKNTSDIVELKYTTDRNAENIAEILRILKSRE